MPLPKKLRHTQGGGNETHSHLQRSRTPTRKPQGKSRSK
jgi:hypothetical protein